MRVAALYDIHGNLPALEAVLTEIDDQGVDSVVVGGDITPGPMVREVLVRLLNLDVPVQFIYGNCEVAVLDELAGRKSPKVSEQYRPIMRWTAEQLGDEHRRLLAGWPKTVRLDIRGLGQVLFCHGTPRDEDECFTRLTPETVLLPLFDALDVPLVVCGHTHMQFDRMIGKTRVVNAGSVGMPFGAPGADWLLLGPDVQLRHTLYDLADAADRIRRTTYPQADHFAVHYVQQPPSEAEMLEAFTKASVK
jgi:predicted phosphodiesterase